MNVERRLARVFAASHPVEAAQAIERLPEAERGELLEGLPLEAETAVLCQLEASVAAAALARRQAAAIAVVIAAMPPQNGVKFLERLDVEKRQDVLAHMPANKAGAVRRLMRHAADTAGALMDPHVAAFPADITVNEARKRVRREPQNLIYYLYVVDRDDRLVGVVNLRELLLAPASAPLASVMQAGVQKLSARATWDAILAHPGWLDFHALPVVNREGVLVGVLRYDTLRRLEADAADPQAPKMLPMGLALGELYWSATTALLHGVIDILRPAGGPSPEESRNGT